jgi:signal transduction histidine kinase
MRQYLNWKSYLVVVALAIVGATLYYTSRLANALALEEQRDARQISEGLRILANIESSEQDVNLALSLIDQNTSTPFMLVTAEDTILSYRNIDTTRIKEVPLFLRSKISEFKRQHAPIMVEVAGERQYVYYGDSVLLKQLRFFPYVQLTIILLFLLVVVIAISAAQRSIQNQVWLGLSKETAHQLGTPLMALTGWIELLRTEQSRPEVVSEAVSEMEKDLERLKLIAERFSKVGSEPQLKEENLVDRLAQMVDYMQKRASSRVVINLIAKEEFVPVRISAPLFDWVVENLIRNALDAMNNAGRIEIKLVDSNHQVTVDVSDTGKGIPRHQIRKVFTPGFTTKKRGWGLGLSLARRIIKEYHNGSIFVKQSEAGKGTTFRIILHR